MIALSTIYFRPDWFRQLLNKLPFIKFPSTTNAALPKKYNWQPITMGILGVFLALQILLPLRHWLHLGYVSWTEEGHRFSWHMKLRDKASQATFIVKDPVGRDSIEVQPLDYLTRRQASKMSTRPDMILQFAHYLGDVLEKEGFDQIAVHADVKTRLNNRPIQYLIKREINLLTIDKNTPIFDWVVPLGERKLNLN